MKPKSFFFLFSNPIPIKKNSVSFMPKKNRINCTCFLPLPFDKNVFTGDSLHKKLFLTFYRNFYVLFFNFMLLKNNTSVRIPPFEVIRGVIFPLFEKRTGEESLKMIL